MLFYLGFININCHSTADQAVPELQRVLAEAPARGKPWSGCVDTFCSLLRRRQWLSGTACNPAHSSLGTALQDAQMVTGTGSVEGWARKAGGCVGIQTGMKSCRQD